MFGRRVRYLVCIVAMATAAGSDASAQAPSRIDRALHTLADDASALPPELAADALIRIAGSARVNNAWKRQLLTDAFFKAYAVREAYRRSTPQAISPETRQGADLLASSMSLNRVSLQVRATQLMAYVDQRGARELFEWIDLNPSEAVCEDALVAAVDEYYTALSLLARTTFGNNRADALRFFELYIWRARLPSEMPAVARAMMRFDPNPAEIPYFETLLSSILQTGSRDPRGFSASAFDIVSRTSEFLKFEAKAARLEGIHLMDTMRGYLVNQMKGPRCADSISESMTPAAFNTALRGANLQYDVRPIEDTILPSRMLGTERIDQFWQTGESKGLRERLFQLRGPGKEPLPLKIRETTEWRNEAEQLLNAVEQWTGRSERVERDYLAQKSLLFVGLLELVPPSTLRTRTIRGFVEYLRHADNARDVESLWFAFVNRLLELSRGNDRRDILAAFDDAHHPALSVYAQLERLVPVGTR